VEFDRTLVAVPEGDAPTRARVVRAILEKGPSTAADLAAELDLTPAAVRRHLDHLVDEGTVEAGEQRVHGTRGRGRPARVFRLTESGRDLLENQYDDLATQALRFLRETQGEEAVLDFARQRVRFIEAEHAAVSAAKPELTPAEALAEVLTGAGYAAGVRELPLRDGHGGEQLCQQHCPVSHVAHEFPQLCEAETEAIASVLGRHVQRLATIAHGDGVCTTCIPDLPPTATPKNPATKDGAST